MLSEVTVGKPGMPGMVGLYAAWPMPAKVTLISSALSMAWVSALRKCWFCEGLPPAIPAVTAALGGHSVLPSASVAWQLAKS